MWQEHSHVYLDNFLPPPQAEAVRGNVRAAYQGGHLKHGVLAGGKSGSSLSYVHTEVRGDVMGWFFGSECEARGWKALAAYYVKVCTCAFARGQGTRAPATLT